MIHFFHCPAMTDMVEGVSAFAAHGVFPDDCWRRMENQGFHAFGITDSCPRQARLLRDRLPFRVLFLAANIARIVREPLVADPLALQPLEG